MPVHERHAIPLPEASITISRTRCCLPHRIHFIVMLSFCMLSRVITISTRECSWVRAYLYFVQYLALRQMTFGSPPWRISRNRDGRNPRRRKRTTSQMPTEIRDFWDPKNDFAFCGRRGNRRNTICLRATVYDTRSTAAPARCFTKGCCSVVSGDCDIHHRGCT
jgi:hypothetical protein